MAAGSSYYQGLQAALVDLTLLELMIYIYHQEHLLFLSLLHVPVWWGPSRSRMYLRGLMRRLADLLCHAESSALAHDVSRCLLFPRPVPDQLWTTVLVPA